MAKLLGVDVPKLLYQSMGSITLAVTFTKVTPGTPDANNPGKGSNPTTATYTCKGFVSEYQATSADSVRQKQRVIAVLGASLPSGVVPAPNDRLQVPDDPQCGAEVMIIVDKGVTRDPTGAIFLCTCKA